jgi:hypothetical protein
MRILITLIISISFIVVAAACYPDEPQVAPSQTLTSRLSNVETRRQTVVDGLAPLSFVTGDWRGVAQPRRGSNSGAWSQNAHAAWSFDGNFPCLIITLEPGEKCSQIVLAVSAESKRAIVEVHQPDRPSMVLEMTEQDSSSTSDSTDRPNQAPRNSWAFESTGEPRIRITVRKINELRMALLFEESNNAKTAWRRQYEIGLTREGERLARGNTDERECIVTGGLGSISVTHGGKTYYVCCGGCRQAFKADPEGTIAAYLERSKERSKRTTE